MFTLLTKIDVINNSLIVFFVIETYDKDICRKKIFTCSYYKYIPKT